MRRARNTAGYILIETTVAVVVLGISAITIHGVIRQAIQTRGQVQDYTHVRLLMEDYMARLELQPYVFAEEGDGVFEEGEGRFKYSYVIEAIDVPEPVLPLPRGTIDGNVAPFKYQAGASKLIRVAITTRWSRGQMDFEETLETLLPQGRLYVPRDQRGATIDAQ